MRILCNEVGHIIAIGEDCVFGDYEGEQKWKISENLYAIDNNYTAYELGDTVIPSDYYSGKYLYKDSAFVENPDWVEPSLPIDEQMAELRAQMNALLGEE